MNPADAVVKHITIHIGGLQVSREPLVVDTVLGSCISACLFDAHAGVGGMNHFMLPDGVDSGNPTSTRYGVNAMELLINNLMRIGASRERLQAKVFGGGHVLRIREHMDSVPWRNIQFVRGFLEAEHIPLVSEDVGGYRPRRLLFYTHTGKALLKRLGSAEAGRTAQEEMAYLQGLRKRQPAGDVTLF